MTMSLLPSSAPRVAQAFPAVTSAEPNGSPAALRFRERVRSRIGTAELLAFCVGTERFAVDVRALDEALDAPPIERLVLAAGAILVGLTRFGNRSIPVFDAGRLLGLPMALGGQLLILRSGTSRIGLLVDQVDDVITLDLGTIKPPPFDAGDELLLGVTWQHAQLTGILDARALITMCQQRSEGGP